MNLDLLEWIVYRFLVFKYFIFFDRFLRRLLLLLILVIKLIWKNNLDISKFGYSERVFGGGE